jgi:hypothetical protein
MFRLKTATEQQQEGVAATRRHFATREQEQAAVYQASVDQGRHIPDLSGIPHEHEFPPLASQARCKVCHCSATATETEAISKGLRAANEARRVAAAQAKMLAVSPSHVGNELTQARIDRDKALCDGQLDEAERYALRVLALEHLVTLAR